MCALADISSKLDIILRDPLYSRIEQLEELVGRLSAKELQGAFPHILASVFGIDGRQSWGLRSTVIRDPRDTKALYEFLSPCGTIFKICYKLISDPQLKYAFPICLLPVDLIHILESGRIPQFYLDLLNIDVHSRKIVSLNLNPFDYYIFHFAVHIYCASYDNSSWDAWNTMYYELSCDYLFHFLPSDVNTPVLPHIPYFTGKTPAVSPIQSANRHSQFPLLLITPDNAGSGLANAASTQFHPRGEIWRSETVLQVFIDVWLITASHMETLNLSNCIGSPRGNYPASEHVRIARALIKQCHGFSLCGSGDPTSIGDLRRTTTILLAPRAHAHIRHLMHTWPLDSSFRLVLELWFSFIQPWRYINMNKNKNKKSPQMQSDTSTDEANKSIEIDSSFIPFISENLLSYTEIFQLVVPRFLRLNLTVPKNSIMLFRLTKVFSQSNLVKLLMDVENLIANDIDVTTDANLSMPQFNFSYSNLNSTKKDKTGNSLDISMHQSSSIPTQECKLFNGVDTVGMNQYHPLLLGGGRNIARDLLVYAIQAQIESQEIIRFREIETKKQNGGIFSSFYYWLVGDYSDDVSMEEIKKVPTYLSTAVSQLAKIFSLDSSTILHNMIGRENFESFQSIVQTNMSPMIDSIRSNSAMLPKQAKVRSNTIKYMGDPDKQPIKTYENQLLVRLFQQISMKLNDMYSQEMISLWKRRDFLGILMREILLPPCKIHTYAKSNTHNSTLVCQILPPRVSFRNFGSHTFMFWFIFICGLAYLFGYSFIHVVLFLATVWLSLIFVKISYKFIKNRESVMNNADLLLNNLNNNADMENH